MTFPANVLSLAVAAGSNFLNTAFGGSVAMSTGLNLLISNLIAVQKKLGTGGATAPARGQALVAMGAADSDGNQESTWDYLPRKNRIINGSMVVNQRPSMPSTDNSYTVDRWRMLLGAASVCTPSQETSDTPAGGSHRALKLAATATNNNKFGAFSPLEGMDIYDLRGQVVSLSFWAKVSNARIGDVRAAVLQNTGTEDSISATPITTWGNEGAGITTYSGSWAQANTPANLSVTTSWVRYYIENITISASANNLGVFIWSDDKTTTSGDYLLITDVQLEKGAVCTDVDRRPLQHETELCKRYHEVFGGGGTTIERFAIGHCTTTTAATFILRYVRKRTAPTITISANADLGATTANEGAIQALSGFSTAGVGLDSGAALVTVASGLVAGNATSLMANSTANARINIAAEL